jgi:predicted ATPase/class 3 adenylate cyclase
MDFYEVVAQVVNLLHQQGRVTYRGLKRQFALDDDVLEDLKAEILYAQPQVVDDAGKGLIWTGATVTPTPALETSAHPGQPTAQEESATQAALPLPDPHTPDAERRQLTVMFCDLVGSTELSGQLDAEEYRELVRAYQTTCGDVIERFGCHIAQTLGDGLLVYSGYPIAHDNDAERAVRVGLGILEAMKALNERLEQEKGICLGVRIGIHTGPVVVGDVGAGARHEHLALGEVPNVAARLQGLAEPDTVVLSAATYRLIQGYFDCEPLGEHDLRGVAQPIAVYRVLGDRGMPSRLDVAATRGLTPLVGRESEVTLLFERWEQAKDGQGQVVLLSGEAGIGKSRLVQVLKDHVAEGPHTRIECRSSPYFTNSALYPITDFLQRMLRFQTDDTPEQKLEKLVRNLSQYRLQLDESVPLFGALLSLSAPEDEYPPLNLSPQRQRLKTLEAIVAVILELAEREPVLFVLEDLHWTDPTTLELIDLLIDQIPTASTCILMTCRPEFQPGWSHRSYLSELSLNRLSRTQIEQIATQVAGGKTLPTDLIQQLVEKTDGVPLYVEEMTKAVLESGHLKETDEQYELMGSLSSLAIPATLQDSLMARLDRLVTAKAVAQYAAVIGRQFSYELLYVVSQLDEATLQRELGRLVEAELVYQRGVIPDATYLFKHALVQDTAYESLLRSTRQGYHRRIAEVLSERFPETAEAQPELLAHHYTESDFNEQAVIYWHQAGQRAIQRSAYAEAISYLTKGLNGLMTLPDSEDRARQELNLQMALGPLLRATKGNAAPEAASAYVRAQELCQQIGETSQLFTAMSGIWFFHLSRMEVHTARELAEQYLALAQCHYDSALLCDAYYMMGTTLSTCGELVLGRTHMEQSIVHGDAPQFHRHTQFPGQAHKVSCLIQFAWPLWFLGYPDQAIAQNQAALALAQEMAHPHTLASALRHRALIYHFRQQGLATQEQADVVIALSREHGFSHLLAWGTMLRNWALVAQGQSTVDVDEIRQNLDAYQATGAGTLLPLWLAVLADAHGKAKHLVQGLEVLDEALIIGQHTGVRFYQAELYRLKGEFLLQQSSANVDEAESNLNQALEVSRHQQAKSLELRAATSLARLWQSQGKRQDAYELLEPVYDWFTEGFDTADLIDAKQLLDALN